MFLSGSLALVSLFKWREIKLIMLEVVSWLLRSTSERTVLVRDLCGDIVLCSLEPKRSFVRSVGRSFAVRAFVYSFGSNMVAKTRKRNGDRQELLMLDLRLSLVSGLMNAGSSPYQRLVIEELLG